MDEEQVLNQQSTEDAGKVSLINILYALRAQWLLILIVTVLFAAGGFAYSKVRKPVYTATVPVLFDVSGIKSEKNEEDQVSNTNYLFAYLDQAVGICTSGITIDRANVYYDYYLKFRRENPNKNINDFMSVLSAEYETVKTTAERKELPSYPVNDENIKQYREKYFTSDKFGTNYKHSSNSADTNVNFNLWVKDLDSGSAKDMACIYAFAADFSLNKILQFDKSNGNAGIINLAGSSAGVNVSSDASLKKVVIIAAVMGLALSLIAVYITYLMDNTVKSKEQLERISGAGVIAYIDDVAEVK